MKRGRSATRAILDIGYISTMAAPGATDYLPRMIGQPVLLPTLAVAIAAVIWGLWWIPLRALEQSGLTGDLASLALYAIGTLAMLPVALVRGRRLRADGPSLLAIGLCFGAALTMWNHALITGEVVRVVLLFYLCSIWATVFAVVFLRERVSPVRGLSIAMGLGGAAVVLGFEGGMPLPRTEGEWMAIASGLVFAIGLTLLRRTGQSGGFERTFATFAIATVVALVFTIVAPGDVRPAWPDIAGALPFAATVTVLLLFPMTWLLLWGGERLEPGRVTVLLLIEIVVAAVSAAALTDEPFGWREIVGCLLIVGAGVVEAGEQMWATRPVRAAAAAAGQGGEDVQSG